MKKQLILIIVSLIASLPLLKSQSVADTFDIGKRKIYYQGKKIKKVKDFKQIIFQANDVQATSLINSYEKSYKLALIPMLAGNGVMALGVIDGLNGESGGTKVASGAILLAAGVAINSIAWKRKGKKALRRYNAVIQGSATDSPFNVPIAPSTNRFENIDESTATVGLAGLNLFAGLNLMADPFDLGYIIKASYQFNSEQPILIAPFFEAFNNNHENYRRTFKTQYYGASLIYMPQADGFYAGLGLGGSTRKYEIEDNRFSISISPQVGFIHPINDSFGAFAEARYYWNQRTSKDLEDVKDGKRSSLYIFDNDLRISIGMYHRLGG